MSYFRRKKEDRYMSISGQQAILLQITGMVVLGTVFLFIAKCRSAANYRPRLCWQGGTEHS